MSPRDAQGHGTHVASTAAGAAVTGASVFGFANGTARRMASHARLAIYKACWAPEGYCDESDIAAAMEQAIADGVDILSISIHSDDVPFHMNHVAIAAFGAIEKGVFVSAIAGNQGPSSSSLSHTVPWITTVGASSIDRDFPASVVLGNQEIYRGTSDFKGGDGKLQGPFPLVYVSASSSSKRCLDGSLDQNVVKGKIVLCQKLINPDDSSAPEKAREVARAGGARMIVANEELLGAQQLFPDILRFPAITVSFKAGERIKSYINSTSSNTTATAAMRITGLTIVGNTAAAPIVAAFSSRVPSKAYPSVLKPDMLAPGVNILAAYGNGVDYYFNSGTSMACPHVSGIAALIKAIHPTWSPAAIKSALMTTSYIVDNRKRAIRDSVSMEAADSFDMGSGHVDPISAMDPGLVYDMAPQPGNKSIKVSRRSVTNVGAEGNVVYRVSVKSPPGVNISVEPETLVFNKLYDKASYSVEFESNRRSPSASEGELYDFGEIRWTCIDGGTQVVRSPVAFTWQASN
ncbi:subtilisin-like protease SBT1.8 [Cryptomeria japonica]|uniref:subtilisin-like protease SBT1.8 n=1 Tax=Cryptomeria japonica TaxID=3369 RepID=UPI0025AD4B52|nr:subtilisin-like protease SBT1.8 [Cryptomeria japonica]